MAVKDGVNTYKGTDAPSVYDDGRPKDIYFYDNDILNTGFGVRLKFANKFNFIGEVTYWGSSLPRDLAPLTKSHLRAPEG